MRKIGIYSCCAIALMACVSFSYAHRFGNDTSPNAPRRWENPIPRLDFSNPADLNVGAPKTVRLIYFLPNDRPYRADVEKQMKTEIRTVQTFYANALLAHGFGQKTFRIETDQKGEPMVHRVDGQHPFSHYDNTDGIAVIDELAETYDFTANIYFVVLGADVIRTVSGEPVGGIGHRQTKTGGWLLVANEISWDLVAHEVGHAFGLNHDFRGGAYIMSYNPDPNQLSACAAFFLSVHPYFNPDTPADTPAEQLPTIELLSPRRYPPGSKSVPVRVEVSDSDGLHQVLLHTVGGLQECRRLTGETKAVVEFDYDGGFGLEGFTALSHSPTGELFIESVDTLGNVEPLFFTLAERSPYHIADLPGHGEAVLSVAFSPEGILAVGADDGSVTLWNVATRQQITTLPKAEHWVEKVAFSPDGRLLAVGTREQVTLWSVATQQQVAHFRHPSEFTSVAFSPEGETIAAGMTDGTITLWDVETHRNIATLTHGNYVSDVAFSGQGIMASASDDGTVHLWDVVTQKKRTTITHEDLVLFVAFSPDGDTLAYGGWGRIPIQLFDVATQQPIARITYNSVVTDVAFSRDGESLASSGWDSTVQLWDVQTQVPFATFPSAEPLKTVAFSPSGHLLATGGTETGTVELWDTSAVLPLREAALTAVDIPDKNLRAAIADALGVNASEPITKGQMKTLTEFYAPNANISDLTGLQFATHLRSLFLGYEYGLGPPINSNAVDDLTPIAELTRLTFLELSGTDLSDISALSGLTNLTVLGLESNSISDISALSALTKLTELWLWGNPLNAMAYTTHIPAHQSRGTEVHFDPPKADVNGDGVVNIFDLVRVANAFGTDAEANPAMDVNTDGEINILDLVTVANFFAKAQ